MATRQVAGSITNQDFAVDFGDGRRVLWKTGPPAELAAEARALAWASAEGVPVPALLTYEPHPGPTQPPFIILEWLPSQPPPSREALGMAGRALRALHARKVPGYGPLQISGNEATSPEAGRGRYSSWSEFIAAVLNDGDYLVTVDLLSRGQRSAIRDQCGAVAYSSWTRQPGVLLHGDLKPEHILSTGPQLHGIIDWGDAFVGDPAWDLARASMMDMSSFDQLLDGYEPPRPVDSRLLAAYRVLWNVRSLAGEHRAGGDWFAVYRQRIERDLDWLASER
ncbi:phosphotransferase family protein [Streptomyces sp. NPDC090442]|uniref:phosphotransferase family protein n=1 Tax=Streptomyces sp. NPDC090442 TaxID=3365962 RepID=UPI003820C77F